MHCLLLNRIQSHSAFVVHFFYVIKTGASNHISKIILITFAQLRTSFFTFTSSKIFKFVTKFGYRSFVQKLCGVIRALCAILCAILPCLKLHILGKLVTILSE